MNRFIVVLALAFSLVQTGRASNVPIIIESNRTHTAAGAFGCTVSGATVATPNVITCAAAHNLISGDQVTTNAPQTYSWRAYQFQSLRMGVMNARIRVDLQSQDPTESVNITAFLK